MAVKIRDYQCSYGNSVGISAEITEGLGLEFPDAYQHADTMKILARAIKEHDGAGFCLLPFCRTVESEAMGAKINMGDAKSCPRAGEYICTKIEEVMDLPDIDFTKGRISELLKAAGELKDEGEVVAVEVTGPFTMLNNIIDARFVFKALRKEPEKLYAVLNKLADQLLLYVDEIKKRGVDIVILSDSAGALNILGPKFLAQVTEAFTYGFAKKLEEKADENLIFMVCPKFIYALIDTGHAEYVDYDFGHRVDFLEAMLAMKGKAKFAGQVCIKDIGVSLPTGKFKEMVLK